MGRPAIEDHKRRNIEKTYFRNPAFSALKIWHEAKERFGNENIPSSRKTYDIVQKLRKPFEVFQREPAIKPWGAEWLNNSDALETLLILHQIVIDPAAKWEAFDACDGITNRQGRWGCLLRRLFDLSCPRDTKLLLWFAIQYAGLEEYTPVPGSGGEREAWEMVSDYLDRWLMEWTGRIPQLSTDEKIPDEEMLSEWLYSYFKAVSQGDLPSWFPDWVMPPRRTQ